MLGPLADGEHADRFDLRPEHLCTRLVRSGDGNRIEYAEVHSLHDWKTIRVEADQFFVAGNAILTPQLLWASGIRPEPLGRYLTEQPVAFCQIVLRHDLVEGVPADPRFADRASRTARRIRTTPYRSLNTTASRRCGSRCPRSRPWHCQIHRDAFHYGDLAPNIDSRLIVDLRWFGIVDPRPDNRVTFSERHTDSFGMPQPTFEFTLGA